MTSSQPFLHHQWQCHDWSQSTSHSLPQCRCWLHHCQRERARPSERSLYRSSTHFEGDVAPQVQPGAGFASWRDQRSAGSGRLRPWSPAAIGGKTGANDSTSRSGFGQARCGWLLRTGGVSAPRQCVLQRDEQEKPSSRPLRWPSLFHRPSATWRHSDPAGADDLLLRTALFEFLHHWAGLMCAER